MAEKRSYINTYNAYFSGDWTSSGDRLLTSSRARSAPTLLRTKNLSKGSVDDVLLQRLEKRLENKAVKGNMDEIARESAAWRSRSRNLGADIMNTDLYDLRVKHNSFTRGRQSRKYRSVGAPPPPPTSGQNPDATPQRMRKLKETLEKDLHRQCERLDAYDYVGVARPSPKAPDKAPHVELLMGFNFQFNNNNNNSSTAQGGGASSS